MERLDLEIRRHLADYLAGKTPIEEFRRWFVPKAWNIHKRADLETAGLAHEVDLLLAEFDHGDWTEPELRERLRPLVTRYSFTMGPVTLMTSGAAVKRFQVLHQTAHAGTRPAVVFG